MLYRETIAADMLFDCNVPHPLTLLPSVWHSKGWLRSQQFVYTNGGVQIDYEHYTLLQKGLQLSTYGINFIKKSFAAQISFIASQINTM